MQNSLKKSLVNTNTKQAIKDSYFSFMKDNNRKDRNPENNINEDNNINNENNFNGRNILNEEKTF